MRTGHIFAVAAVEAFDRLGALADGGANAIHRGIAAANDDDILALGIQRAAFKSGYSIAKALAVGRGQIIQCRHHAIKIAARQRHRACLVHAGRNQHGVMLGAQCVHRGVTANFKIGVEMDARILKPLHAAHDDVFLQLKSGDAICQQAAHAVVSVVHMYVISRDAQIFCGGQATRATANDAHRLPARWSDRNGFDPALFPSGVGDIFFDRANGHGIVTRKFNDAIAFAQAILRTDTAANFGHRAGQIGKLIRLTQAPFGGQAQPIRNMVVQRAMHRTIWHATLRTTRCLIGGVVGCITLSDFGKIFCAKLRGPLFRVGLRFRDKFQHRVFGHSAHSLNMRRAYRGKRPMSPIKPHNRAA